MTLLLDDTIPEDTEASLNSDVAVTTAQFEREGLSCQVVVDMSEHGCDAVAMNMAHRVGLLSTAAVGMSQEGLGGLLDDAGKLAAHGTAAHTGDLGAKILKHATSVERGVLAEEKMLLRKLENMRKLHMGEVIANENAAFASAKSAGHDRNVATMMMTAEGDKTAAEILKKFNLTDEERALFHRHAAEPSSALSAILHHRIVRQQSVIKRAEAALKEAQLQHSAPKVNAAQKTLDAAKATESKLQEHLAESKTATTAHPSGTTGNPKSALSAKNSIIALTAIAAVGAGLSMLFRSVPASGATVEAKNAYFSKVVSWVKGIHLPWAKLDVNDVGKLMVNGRPVKSALSASEEAAKSAMSSGDPGWTKATLTEAASKVKGISEKISAAFTGLAGQFGHLSDAGATAAHAAEAQSHTVGKAVSIFAKGSRMAMVFALIALVASVIYFVVIGGMRLVKKSVPA